MRSRLLLLLPLSLLLVACATTPPGTEVRPPESQEEPEAREEGWRPEELPKAELSHELLMRFLVGDLALQRGQPGLAARSWLELARRTRDPRVARRALELAVASGQVAEAQELAQIWSEAAPSSPVARQLALSLAIRANKLVEAEVLIGPFLQEPPRELANFYLQLHLLWDRSVDPKAMWRLTDKLTAGQGTMPEAHFARAVVHAMQGRDDAAQDELDAALRLRAWWDAAVLYKAQLLVQKKDKEAAIRLLRQAMEAVPAQLSFRLTLARTLAEGQREAEARAMYESILAQAPDHLESLVGAGLLALQQHDLDAAYTLLRAAEQRNPRNLDQLRLYLGQIEEERYRFREALDWYRQVAGADKPKAAQRVPRLLAKLGQREAAWKAFAALPAAEETEQLERIQLEAQIWRDLKQPEKAHAILTQALQTYPEAGDLYYDRSLLADLMNDIPAAEADLRRALALQPDSVPVRNALGYVLASRTDRLAEAEVLLQQAIAAEPDNPVIIDSVGWLRFRQGRLQEALQWLARAYGKLRDPEVAAHYAEALWRAGREAQAREVFAAGARLEPDHPVIVDVRRRLGF